MLYTVTMNPTMDLTFVTERIAFGEPLRALQVQRTPGGKGINVSRALRSMEIDSVALAMVGGFVGDELVFLLREEGLDLEVVRLEGDTRVNVVVLGEEDKSELAIWAMGPEVTESELQQMVELMLSREGAVDLLVLSGSLPPGVDDGFYQRVIVEAGRRGIRTVLDSRGEPLKKGVEGAPYMIKPNLDELSGLAGRSLSGDDEVVGFAKELLGAGVVLVVVSMGRHGALMISHEGVWKGKVLPLAEDTVGAGDSMVAGLVAGITRGLPVDKAFHEGLAFSLSAVMNEGPGLTEPKTYGEAYSLVRIDKVE